MFKGIWLRSESGVMIKVLHIIDCLLVAALLPLMNLVHRVPWDDEYSMLSVFVLLISYLVFYQAKLYKPWRGIGFYREFWAIIKAWVVVLGLVFFALFLTKSAYDFSRRVLLTWGALTPIFVFIVHFGARYFLRYIRNKGYNVRRSLIVGAGDLGLSFFHHLKQLPWSGIQVIGFFDDYKTSADFKKERVPVLGAIDKLSDFMENNEIDYVYIALPMRAEAKIDQVISTVRSKGAFIYLIPDLFAYKMFNSEVQSLGEMMLISFNPSHSYKRYFDIFFSLLVLIFMSPVFALIALLIKLEDRGPVFYRHRRLTTAGRSFGCFKFRTMVQNADAKLKALLENDPAARREWEKTFKLKNDPRVTSIGKLLRKTSMDELPQFWNVVKGEMSVVGARPIVFKELCEYYNKSAGLYCSIKPGVTGPWQVNGRSDTEDYEERVRMDADYILYRNLWIDMKIIVKTVWKVLKQDGAY